MSDFVFFDLETSQPSCYKTEILDLGAVHGNGSSFQRYLRPERHGIHWQTSRIHGITELANGELLVAGDRVISRPDTQRQGLVRFLNYLRNNSNGYKTFLVSHGGSGVDPRALVCGLIRHNLVDSAHGIIYGFLDTEAMFRDRYPDLESYKLSYLMDVFADETQMAYHSALQDAEGLKKVVEVMAEEAGYDWDYEGDEFLLDQKIVGFEEILEKCRYRML